MRINKIIVFTENVADWWTIHKIHKWKNQNKTPDNYRDERLDNTHLKVLF